MQTGLFITATDTDTGKTFITGAIAAAIKARGITVGVVKPVASGGTADSSGRLVSADATFLMLAAGMGEARRQQVNPVCLAPALTPAVAAVESGVTIDVAQLIGISRAMLACSAVTLIEGVGGITAPLWQDYLVADMMLALGLPGLLVTRPGLGTINHTVLTAKYASQRGIQLAGIIINRWPEERVTVRERSNLEYIERLTGLPVLGKFPAVPGVISDQTAMARLAVLAEKHLPIDHFIKLMTGGGCSADGNTAR
ncbi:dethiobiotin synthase [Sporomusa termitida]|uniref:ATP-dependent dethiobiotin synthetase BioD n=1 Tax=Sporomusa termitida TaxID=2377 RepID=A0A517DRH3_9FIRM|nr:dethiobiotin synthase [Sporomusa termitida]QDR79960.1 ATP-dependent dethiobiotin synthetase BioD 1 [Sporomusa termitida]